MRKARYTFSILLQLILPLQLWAQAWTYRQFTAEQGLPSTEVYDILQDRKGYIWVATDRGVARFDGYAFESFTTVEGLSNNVVFRMCEGPDGKIWLGEMPGTASYYENGKIYPAPGNAAILRSIEATSFPLSMTAGKDDVAIGYTASKILRLHKGRIEVPYPEDSIRDVVSVRGNAVLYGTSKRSGGTLVDDNGKKHYFHEKDWLHNAYRIDALRRRNGDLMVTVSGAVRIFGKKKVTRYSTRDIVSFCETPDSCLYAVSWKGFYRYAPNEAFVPGGRYCHLKGYNISKVIMDREGGIWVATRDKGVFYCAHPGFYTYDFKDDVAATGSPVYSLCGDFKGRVFAGVQGGSVYYLNQGKEPARIFSSPNYETYEHLYYDTVRDCLLMGRLPNIKAAPYAYQICHLPFTGNGVIAYQQGYLSGSYAALRYYYPTTGQQKWGVQLRRKPEPRIQCMLRLTEDSIFAGTLNGLCYFDKQGLHPMLTGTAFATERINDIECIGRRLLVIATVGRGLLMYDLKTGELGHLGEKDGLVSDVINDAALAADGSIWLASNKGLSRLQQQARGGYKISNYTSYTGIPAADIKNIHVDGHTVYMGSHIGLTLFDSRTQTVDLDPEILLKSVYVNDREVQPSMLGSLRSKENNLRVSYLSIIPKMQGKVLYRYRLKGEEVPARWVYVREPQLFLSSVEPGAYQLVIQACNAAGQWSKAPLVLAIHIAVPFWKTWWFIACWIAGIAGAIILSLVIRLKRLREKTASEKLMLDYQQQALINQINPHFLFNSMNSIQKYILREDKEKAVSFVAKFAKLMRMGLEHSREAFIPLQKELELLRIYILLERERFGKKIDYVLEIEPGLETRQMLIPPMLIQPFLENAIRHGILNKESEGKIILRLYRQDHLLFCEVEDDGVGRKKAMEILQEQGRTHRSFAISINTSRLQLLARSLNSHYFFEVTDKLDPEKNPAGTIVKLVIPFSHDY